MRLRPEIYTAFALVTAICLGCATDVTAGEWRISPRFSIGETYSDNSNLDNSNEVEDFITRATPGVSIRGKGRRLQLNLDYNLQSLTYANDSSRNNINHQLQSDAEIEVLRDRLYIEADAMIYRALVSNTGRITNRNFRNTENNTGILTYGVAPRFEHHFGTWADWTSRIEYTSINRTGSLNAVGVGNGIRNDSGSGSGLNFSTSLKSGRRFGRDSWAVNGSQKRFNNDSGRRATTRSRIDGVYRIALSRFFRINTMLGFEDNEGSTGQGFDSSVIWEIGGTFSLSERTSLTGTFGHRAFGDTKSFEFSYGRRRITIRGGYQERLRNTNEQLRDQRLIPLNDAFGTPVFDPFAPNSIDLPLGTLSLTDDVLLTRDFDASVEYTGRRDTFSASVFRSEREGGTISSPETAIGTSINWTHAFSRRLSGGVRGSYRSGSGTRIQTTGPRVGVTGNNDDVDVFFVTPFMSYLIGPHTSGRLEYSYTTSDARELENQYTENSLTGTLSFAF